MLKALLNRLNGKAAKIEQLESLIAWSDRDMHKARMDAAFRRAIGREDQARIFDIKAQAAESDMAWRKSILAEVKGR